VTAAITEVEMTLQRISTDQAPEAIGPYSQAVRAGDFIYFSGQIPLDPATGALVAGGIVEQTEQIMKNIAAMLKACALSFDAVVKTTIFLTDLNHFAQVNEIYGRHFAECKPARATVEVAGLPKGAAIEIEWICFAG
jgi:2-iminobutanoate/2-iminopropanoate deaminase